MKIEDIVYGVVVMMCLTWATVTVVNKYAPEVPKNPQVEQELIEIIKVVNNDTN